MLFLRKKIIETWLKTCYSSSKKKSSILTNGSIVTHSLSSSYCKTVDENKPAGCGICEKEGFNMLFWFNHISPHAHFSCYEKIQNPQGSQIITASFLNLLQFGFSRRAWTYHPLDNYKGNGRVRHETLNLQM